MFREQQLSQEQRRVLDELETAFDTSQVVILTGPTSAGKDYLFNRYATIHGLKFLNMLGIPTDTTRNDPDIKYRMVTGIPDQIPNGTILVFSEATALLDLELAKEATKRGESLYSLNLDEARSMALIEVAIEELVNKYLSSILSNLDSGGKLGIVVPIRDHESLKPIYQLFIERLLSALEQHQIMEVPVLSIERWTDKDLNELIEQSDFEFNDYFSKHALLEVSLGAPWFINRIHYQIRMWQLKPTSNDLFWLNQLLDIKQLLKLMDLIPPNTYSCPFKTKMGKDIWFRFLYLCRELSEGDVSDIEAIDMAAVVLTRRLSAGSFYYEKFL